MIDTHCHLSKDDYNDIDLVIKEDEKALISEIVVSGCSLKDIKEVLELKDKYDIMYVTLGFHPEYADDVTRDDLEYLKKNLKQKKVVGIGEIGLDYHYSKDNKERQLWLFEEQLKIALEFDLPVVIHSRDATLDTIETLKKYKVKGIIHCFSGSLETAEIYIKMGFYLGIGGVVTFKNSKLKEVVKSLPLTSIVLETDSPYLSPEPYRGKQNSSKNIPIIASCIASIKDCSIDEVEKITNYNARHLFDFNNK